MKDKEAAGIDEMPIEVWKYGGKEMREWVWIMCNRVWKGEGWSNVCKEGVVVPIVKRGKGEEVKDYRGVTLMPTLYKIYVTVLLERLKKEVEQKQIIPSNQIGFRKGMGVMDNIYVPNSMIDRSIGKKRWTDCNVHRFEGSFRRGRQRRDRKSYEEKGGKRKLKIENSGNFERNEK